MSAPWAAPRPIALTEGERLIWEGGPDWRAVAARVFHVRVIILYFALLTLVNLAIARTYEGRGWPTIAAAMPTLLAGLGCAVILGGLAWAVGRTTRYTITTRHVVMQFGVAIPATLVLPLHRIAGTSVRVHGDHTGDISLRLFEGEQVPFLKLWPHARPWRILASEPMLRDVPRAAVAATMLSRTLASVRG